MTLEKFKELMDVIKSFLAEKALWQNNLDELFPESYLSVNIADNLFDSYIDLIQDNFQSNKTYKYDWVFYYIFDLDMGKKPQIIKANNEEILLDSEEKLYDILTKNYDTFNSRI